jgi:peptidoglycan/LPS O-acetylase OafA/YrhL
MSSDSAKSHEHFVQLDGLRGIAIIIVVLSHCGILYQGGIANAIFFPLAGFFLINPFKDAYEKRFLSFRGILNFYKNRAIRILPAYYLILLFVFLQTGFRVIPKNYFINLLFFGEIYGHLWFIYAYFWIMFLMPFFIAGFLLLARLIKPLNNDLVCSLIFLFLGGLVRLFFINTDLFDIRIDQVLVGIFAGYLFRYISKSQKIRNLIPKLSVIGHLLIFVILAFVVLTSNEFLELINPSLSEFRIGWDWIYLVSLIMSFFIVLVCLFPNGFTGKILSSKVLLFLGKLVFPIYLLNNFVIDQLNIESKYFLFLCVFSVCIVLAWIIDTAISKIVSLCKKSTSGILNKNMKP